jgi:hypothetical protein
VLFDFGIAFAQCCFQLDKAGCGLAGVVGRRFEFRLRLDELLVMSRGESATRGTGVRKTAPIPVSESGHFVPH